MRLFISIVAGIALSATSQFALAQELNPQPLPPKAGVAKTVKRTRPLNADALNPQPLPPKAGPNSSAIVRTGHPNADALNPQPLPPVQKPKTITAPKAAAPNS